MVLGRELSLEEITSVAADVGDLEVEAWATSSGPTTGKKLRPLGLRHLKNQDFRMVDTGTLAFQDFQDHS